MNPPPHADALPLGLSPAGTVHVHHEHHELGFLRKYVFSTDHKVIGLQFLFTGMFFLVLGGLLAMAIRWQLAWPWTEMPIIGRMMFPQTGRVISPEYYTSLFTMHGTVMIFFVIIPLLTGAFGNFLIPLMVGAPDMAFPKLNMFGYWAMVPAIFFLILAFGAEGGGPAAGWTAYPPLSTIHEAAPGSLTGQTFWLLALTWVGVSSMMGAVNYVTTIAKMRAPGMTIFRMPLSIWGLLVAAVLQLFALPVLTAAGFMQLFDRVLHTGFFTPTNLVVNGGGADYAIGDPSGATAAGGHPLLWQHLFWFYSHPAVYIMVIPAMGFASDIISVHARKPIFGYKPMVYSMAGIAGLGFIVWGHHMFTSGMNPAVGMVFMVSTVMIALPSAIKVFNWIGTLWGARIRFNTPMLFAMAFVSMFIIGGLSGLWMAATPVDVYIHDTYIVVAHFHYVVFAGSVLAIFGAIYHWFPKMFGRLMNETLGKIHFFGTFICTNGVFYMMHQLGVAGLMRRTADPYTYETYAHLQPLNQAISLFAFTLFAWQVFFVINFFHSMFWGKRVGRNPWRANSLEWEAPSPPGHGNFDHELSVHRGPYEYASPEVDEDYLPQTRKL
jgi:cytochrome c oxidase subunit 1